ASACSRRSTRTTSSVSPAASTPSSRPCAAEVDDHVVRWGPDAPMLNSPVLLLALRGWFDTANVASGALDHVVADRAPAQIADIDPDPFYDFTQLRPEVRLEDDRPVLTWPRNEFEAVRFPAHEHDVVVLNG